MILNPFLEGVILIMLGVCTMIADKIYSIGIHDVGVSITSIGVGYASGASVSKAQS